MRLACAVDAARCVASRRAAAGGGAAPRRAAPPRRFAATPRCCLSSKRAGRRAPAAPRAAAGEPADEAVAQAVAEALRHAEVAGHHDGEGEGEAADTPAREHVDLEVEVEQRRCFAIISHPDAGKTTLTEKLLLYGGAIHEAGEVRARRGSRNATSDWMAIERERGISISSTAMSFPYRGRMLNLLDTPGHADFSEDTYRTLSAADNALMLVDAGKGLEPQTRKLFEVCRLNGLPVFTFMNKMDRPALAPLELLDQIEKEFGLATYPVNWPIGSGDRFRGVFHRPTRELHLFTKVASGSREAGVQVLSLDDPAAEGMLDADLYAQLLEELELLEALGGEFDMDAVWGGQLTPVFFGSAANNFGVQLFLDTFLSYAAKPRVMGLADAASASVAPTDPNFTGFVFKLQANMDPRHRDKVAFVRVVSGEFRRGMKVQLARTGRTVALTRPQKMFGQEREIADFAYAGDIIGLNNPGVFAIGDTIFTGPKRQFPLIPSFSPELFATLRNPNTGKYKQFQKGVSELLSEGAVQCLYSLDEFRSAEPILAAVGQLQFEVVQERMRTEYGVETVLDPLPYTVARWVLGGWPAVQKAGRIFNAITVKDMWGRPVLLFRNQWNVDTALSEQPEVGQLSPIGVPPTAAEIAAAAAAQR